MGYNPVVSAFATYAGTNVAFTTVLAAYPNMNAGQQTIIENSLNVDFTALVNTDKYSVSFGLYYWHSDVNAWGDVYADYDEPFGDLFDKALENAIYYVEKVFTIDEIATKQGIIDTLVDNAQEAQNTISRRIGVFS